MTEPTKPENATEMPAPGEDKVKEAVKKMEKQKEKIDPELSSKINAAKALKTIENLLGNGLYPGHSWQQVMAAMSFVQSLHKNLTTEIKDHPQSGLLDVLDGKGQK